VQFHAKSGEPVTVNLEENGEESSSATAPGKVQASAAGESKENCVGEKETGAAETGCDSGKGFAAQQPVFLPQWQQECAAPATLAPGACARTIFVHASIRLQTMASAVFMG
jgi:hypothetical protein